MRTDVRHDERKGGEKGEPDEPALLLGGDRDLVGPVDDHRGRFEARRRLFGDGGAT